MFSYKSTVKLSDAEIEEKARALGMHTDDDCKAYSTLKGDESKND